MQENIKYNISSENSSKINQWLSKFPDDQKKPAIIYALHLIQKENKYIKSEHVDAVANFLGLKKLMFMRWHHFTRCLRQSMSASIRFRFVQMSHVC